MFCGFQLLHEDLLVNVECFQVDYFADDWGFHPLVEYKTSSASSSMSTQFALGEKAVAALSRQYGVVSRKQSDCDLASLHKGFSFFIFMIKNIHLLYTPGCQFYGPQATTGAQTFH